MGKERTLYYRRVRWLSNGDHELQVYANRAHRRLRTRGGSGADQGQPLRMEFTNGD